MILFDIANPLVHTHSHTHQLPTARIVASMRSLFRWIRLSVIDVPSTMISRFVLLFWQDDDELENRRFRIVLGSRQQRRIDIKYNKYKDMARFALNIII